MWQKHLVFLVNLFFACKKCTTKRDPPNQKASTSRRKNEPLDKENISKVPLKQRRSICSLSCAIDVPIVRLYTQIKDEDLKAHTITIKPFLTRS